MAVRFLVLSSILLLVVIQRTRAADTAVENGRLLFVSYGCFQCHGFEGQGGGAGPRISSLATTYTAFEKYLRAPSGQMPPYTIKVTTDRDLENIYAFLRSLPAPNAAKRTLLAQ
jgi:mono/diheme cytochrome c family protein